MEPTDLTVKILQEIREELRGQRTDTQREFGQLRGDFGQLRADLGQMHSDFTARFEIIEKTLKDLSEQLVMLARGIKTALEVRGRVDQRMDELERRLAEVEKREPH